tara:strand:- start:169 stop:1392 length:1224 start_codon:yes stop_codon:yes gene_type:complete
MNTNWSKIGLTFFFIVALLGSIMRLAPFTALFVEYKHILHAHSHVAFQGWVYIILFLLISKIYIDKSMLEKRNYKLLFITTIATVFGIMVSFLIQGYALFSIAFSSLFQVVNYWFVYRFFKDVKSSEKAKKHFFSIRFIKTAMLLMLFSTFGPWAVGILSAKGLAGSEYFNSALYFFFHFQYNGWFTFAVLGLFFAWLEKINIGFDLKAANTFFILSTFTIIPTYSLSLLGMSFANYFTLIATISATIQLYAVYYLMKSMRLSFKTVKRLFSPWAYSLLLVAASCFLFKNILQFASTFSFVNNLAFENKFIIIGYIHLVMIGFISCFLLAILFQLNWLKINKTGLILLVTGFVLSEVTLILLGLVPSDFLIQAIAILSFMMAIGLGLILIRQLTNSKTVLDVDTSND